MVSDTPRMSQSSATSATPLVSWRVLLRISKVVGLAVAATTTVRRDKRALKEVMVEVL
jgi:hypothetical protein